MRDCELLDSPHDGGMKRRPGRRPRDPAVKVAPEREAGLHTHSLGRGEAMQAHRQDLLLASQGLFASWAGGSSSEAPGGSSPAWRAATSPCKGVLAELPGEGPARRHVLLLPKVVFMPMPPPPRAQAASELQNGPSISSPPDGDPGPGCSQTSHLPLDLPTLPPALLPHTPLPRQNLASISFRSIKWGSQPASRPANPHRVISLPSTGLTE